LLTLATVVYGIISGGFFGFTQQTPVLGRIVDLRLFDAGSVKKDDLTNMMRVSILVGMVHISLSVFIKSLRMFSQKNFIQPFSNFAWIIIIWTFFFWYGGPFLGIPGKDPMQMNIMLACAAVIFLTSAGSFHTGKLVFGGLIGLYNGVQFLSDILSYMRIFAIALSGSLIGQTFNTISGDIMSLGVWAIPLGIVVFIAGHTLNIALGLMGAVIHGLRLNFLEYYRWSIDGGGRQFSPLEDKLEKNL
jgi:V/A-type H+-transporting ATPase subunit I